MAARRVYQERERAAALAIYGDLAGQPHRLRETARRAKVPESTLRRWIARPNNAAAADVRAEEEKSLRDLYEEHIRAAIVKAAGKAGEASYRDLMVGIGILDDKLTRADGLPTDRLEIRDWREIAKEEGLDPDEVIAEAERIIAGSGQGG